MVLLVRAFSNDELEKLPVIGNVFKKVFSRGK